MRDQIQQLYDLGLEKFAGDQTKAEAFVEGFVKEAFNVDMGEFTKGYSGGLGGGLGKGVIALGVGLGIHGIASAMSAANNSALRSKFEKALSHVSQTNPIIKDYDQGKVRSFGETIFKFAPHVAADPNLLAHVLSNACHGESLDTMTIRTLADLDGRVVESHKAGLFSPKTYS